MIPVDWSRNDARNRLWKRTFHKQSRVFFSSLSRTLSLSSPVVNSPPVHFCSLLPIFQVAKRFPLAKWFCIHFNARLYTSCWPLCTVAGPLLHRSSGRYCFKRKSSDCALCSAFIIRKVRRSRIFFLINVDLCCLAVVNARKLRFLMGSHSRPRQGEWSDEFKKRSCAFQFDRAKVLWSIISDFSTSMCNLCCLEVPIKLPLTRIWSGPDLDTPTWVHETIDQMVHTPFSASRNDADFFRGATGGIQRVSHVCGVWRRCQVQCH